MKLIIPVESMSQNKGGVILFDCNRNSILNEYVHDREWDRVGWRGGIIYKNYLIATDWNYLHFFDIKNWKHISSYTKNTFNDLHYLNLNRDKKLFVVNTGIDAIERLKINDDLSLTPEKIWFVFNRNKKFTKRDIDLSYNYNEHLKVKPHVTHPNCITFLNGHTFVTCFENETRKERTGCIVDLKTGKIVLNNRNCHDGVIYRNNLYVSETRSNKVLVIKNVLGRKWPVEPDEEIRLNSNGWWRGMTIFRSTLYLFASYGYGKSGSCKMAKIDLRTKETKVVRIPKYSNMEWNAIYQPNVLKEKL